MDRDIALDNPAENPDDDAFNRLAFCNALADRIAALDNTKSAAVIGLYGKWGYGKSTVLNFIRHRLQATYRDSMAVVTFNPWLFTSAEELIAAFLDLLKSIQEVNTPDVRRFVANAAKFSGLLGMIPVVGTAAVKVAEQIGKAAEKTLEKRQAGIVARARERPTIVVMIDDLDRLDRNEVMLMLKMVRLNSNIPKLVYVMAFDDEIIGAVAGSAYGKDHGAGRAFLEKIVQLQFSIPAIGHARLVGYVMQHARAACVHAGIVLDEGEWKEFEQLNSRHFSRRLRTPRQAIRYGAALDFALPMLKGEVDPLHQMVVEGIRILFPDLYSFMRDNMALLTEAEWSPSLIDRVKAVQPDDADASAALELVRYLLASFRDDSAIRRRFAAPRYFDRYFEYSLRPDEIRESEIEQLLGMLDGQQEAAALLLRSLMQRDPIAVSALLDEAVQTRSDSDRLRAAHALMLATAAGMPTPYHASTGARTTAALIAQLLFHPLHGGAEFMDGKRYYRERQADAMCHALERDCHPALLPLLMAALTEINAGLPAYEQPFDEATLARIGTVAVWRMTVAAESYAHQLFVRGSDGFTLFEFWRRNDRESFIRWFSPRVEQDPATANGLLDFFFADQFDVWINVPPYVVVGWIDPLALLHAVRKHHGIAARPVSENPCLELADIYRADAARLHRTHKPA
jgi:hypothetical protein